MLISTDLRPNEARALEALFRAGALSRAALARELGLTRSTTGALVQNLLDACLAKERPDASDGPTDSPTRVGRPGILVEIDGDGAFFLGAYVGVNWIGALAIDLTGTVRARASADFTGAGSSPEKSAEAISDLVAEIIAKLPPGARLNGLNVSVPGFLADDGVTYHAPILGWHGVNLAELLPAALHIELPILLENDANAVAVAETYRVRRREEAGEDCLVVLIENGVGGGIVSAGGLHRGQRLGAGEIGHIPIGDEGFVYDAQRPGRLETFLGKDALFARYRHVGGHATTIDDFTRALERGEPAAVTASRDWARWLARGLATLTCILQPGRIIIAGSVSVVYPFVAGHVEAYLSTYLIEGYPLPKIEMSNAGADGPALGAAYLLHQSALSGDIRFPLRGRKRLEDRPLSPTWPR
ncbi:MAG: ROK family transcriptional regulator [Mesorhizobium sp.]